MINHCFRAILTLIILGLLLSACGQKGPLYLPKNPAQTTSTYRQA